MLKIFNTTALTQRQRFARALLFGTLASAGLLVVYIFIGRVLEFEYSWLFIALGFAIGYVIRETGHGTQIHFSILAVVLCFIVVFLGDIFSFFPQLLSYMEYFPECALLVLKFYITLDMNSILNLVFRAGALIVAFTSARIV